MSAGSPPPAPRRWDPVFEVPVPPAQTCDFLADPGRRPQWQRSLRRVEVLDPGPPHVGQRWVDHLLGGPRFSLETVAFVPGQRWSERGRVGPLEALVTLLFEPAEVDGARGSRITVVPRVRGRGFLRPLGWLASGTLALLIRLDVGLIRAALTDAGTPGTPSDPGPGA